MTRRDRPRAARPRGPSTRDTTHDAVPGAATRGSPARSSAGSVGHGVDEQGGATGSWRPRRRAAPAREARPRALAVDSCASGTKHDASRSGCSDGRTGARRARLSQPVRPGEGQAAVDAGRGVVRVALEPGGEVADRGRGRPADRRRDRGPETVPQRCPARSPWPTTPAHARGGRCCVHSQPKPGRHSGPRSRHAGAWSATTRCEPSRGTAPAPSPTTRTTSPGSSVTVAVHSSQNPGPGRSSRSRARGWRCSPAPGRSPRCPADRRAAGHPVSLEPECARRR